MKYLADEDRAPFFLESALQMVEGQRHDGGASRLFGQVAG
jgi:hypothetical protein